MSNYMKRIFALSFVLLIWGCGKEESISSSIPNRKVDILINTTVENDFDNPYHTKEYPSSGYGGVIVISYYDHNTDLTLAAFDMCCPHEAPAKNIVEKINKLQVQCPNCKSIYSIGDGSGRCLSGPGTERLRSYYVYSNGTSYRIQN